MIALRLTIAATAVAFLAGCTGSSTYGTGTSQEMQLVKDLSSIASFGGPKTRIDYSERPGIVKPAAKGDLPTPAVGSPDAENAFPVSPEERRAARKAAADRGESVAAYGGPDAPRAPKDTRTMKQKIEDENEARSGIMSIDKRRAMSESARKRSKGRKVIGSNQERRYLTEPPTDYRKPYETAPVGDTGQPEASKEFKKKSKGNIFSKLLGRG